MPDTVSPVVIYDSRCGFCRAAVHFLASSLALAGTIQPWQNTDLPAYRLTENQARARMWLIQGRRRHGGATAFAAWARTGNRTAGRLLSILVFRTLCRPDRG
jgi:predicted DCC family thiol-disulfide oxidoreductase YuxK